VIKTIKLKQEVLMNVVDGIRIKEFRQFKKEIRGSRDYLVVGIDIAKERHHAFFGTATGKTLLRRLVFENDLEGFDKLLDQAEALRIQEGLSKVVFGMEPTGDYHKPLGEHLIKCAKLVVLTGGVALKRNRELLDGRWDKNDGKDAANVADLLTQGKCMFYEYPEGKLRDLRVLLSLKMQMRKREHRLRVRIRNHLVAQYFPELDRMWGHSESESMAIVRWCLDPSVIAGLELDEFIRRVAPRDRGVRQRMRLEGIWKTAVESVGCRVPETVSVECQVVVEGLRRLREEIKEVTEEMKQVCLRFEEYPFLLSIPGFGPEVSAQVLGAIGDPHRFENASEVLKMAGLDLGAYRSGKSSETARPVISKRGKAHLRYMLYQAALIASTRNRGFINYYTQKLAERQQERGIKTKMRVKLAAKLLVIAWTLMKKKEPFDPGYLKN
jgi:transposase